MSGYNWLHIAAVGGCLAANVANAQPASNSPNENQAANSAPQQSENRSEEPSVSPFQHSINRIAAALEALKSRAESPEDTERDQKDLKAQEDMAFWAKLMFVATAFQGFISLITLALVRNTLIETRRTANAAVDATKAAVSSERAHFFMQIEGHNLLDFLHGPIHWPNSPNIAMNGFLRITYECTNFGKTPGVIKEISHGMAISKLPPEPVYETDAMNAAYTVISSGGKTNISVCQKQFNNMTIADGLRITSGEEYIWFYGQIEYTDVFGNAQAHRFYRRFFQPADGVFLLQSYDYKHYNQST